VREAEPIGGWLPVFELAKPGSTPLTIRLGPEFAVGIGPLSEFLVYELAKADAAIVQRDLALVLQAEVQVRRTLLGWWAVQLYLDGSPMWGTATYLNRAVPPGFAPGRFRAFAEPITRTDS
jgi:hypothetical protein